GLGKFKNAWHIEPQDRYSVFVMDAQKKPLIDAPVTLHAKNGNLLFSSRTDNTGRAELWANLFEKQEKPSYLEVAYDGKNYTKESIKKFGGGINNFVLPVSGSSPENLDIMFVVDATSSMADEINYLKEELGDIISNAYKQLPCMKINLGSVFYKDWVDDYVTKTSALSPGIDATLNFINEQSASGGGDYPEAVEMALKEAVNNGKWSRQAAARLLFLVLDAPPHDSERVIKQVQEQVALAAQKGIKIIPLAASGVNKSTEYLLRSFALATNGTYVFLTDHSGVGNPHIKPSTNEYDVELLNALILRLIKQYSKTPACKTDSAKQTNDTTRVVVCHEVLTQPVAAKKPNTIAAARKDTLSKNDTLLKDRSVQDKKIIENRSFAFYPNPTKGPVTIKHDTAVNALFLADANGNLIEKYELSPEKNEIDISMYPDGIYYLQCRDGARWYSGKVVLMR
ncbi:MAG TPA: VWA domain-containing protein, partial [Bacteroidia bacterium]|nr:VWA domain-containing protein [Bacteroidia bacterium]